MLGLNVDNLLAGFKNDMAKFETRTDSMADDLTALRALLVTNKPPTGAASRTGGDDVRPRALKRRLILAGLVGMLAAATITAGVAKADPVVDAYIIASAPAVCAVLDAYPSVTGVEGIVAAIAEDGFNGYQAGEIIGRSVIGWCPEYAPVIKAFIAKWAPVKQVHA